MPLSESERSFLSAARVGRLATADAGGRPHVVPVCFALVDAAGGPTLVTPIDEKPKDAAPSALRRVRDVEENPPVALVADRYDEDWTRLGWVQVRGTAVVLDPPAVGHATGVEALRSKYDQYADHALDERPLIRVALGSVRSWGRLTWPAD